VPPQIAQCSESRLQSRVMKPGASQLGLRIAQLACTFSVVLVKRGKRSVESDPKHRRAGNLRISDQLGLRSWDSRSRIFFPVSVS
jgi:hypothetical protein